MVSQGGKGNAEGEVLIHCALVNYGGVDSPNGEGRDEHGRKRSENPLTARLGVG